MSATGGKRIVRMDPDMVQLLLTYMERRKEELPRLKDALAKGDFVSLRTICHNVKGTAKTFGFIELGAVAFRLYAASQKEDAVEFAKVLGEYETELALVELVPR